MRIVYAGTPDFAVPALQRLFDDGHEIAAVYSQPDRPAGRGRKLTASPVKQRAVALGLPVEQPANFKQSADVERLASYQPDIMVVAAYGLILPQAVLDIPRLACINIHASLLPRWRGAAPIQRAVLAGDAVTGISIMKMALGLDTGDVYSRHELAIGATRSAGELHDQLAELGAEAISSVIGDIAADRAQTEPQDESLTCYASKLSKAEARVDWTQSAVQIDRAIRAFNPWPVAYTQLGDKTIRLLAAELLDASPGSRLSDPPEAEPAVDAEPGRVLACRVSGLDVQTGAGVLRVTRLQMPGKKPVDVADFANATNLSGERFD